MKQAGLGKRLEHWYSRYSTRIGNSHVELNTVIQHRHSTPLKIFQSAQMDDYESPKSHGLPYRDPHFPAYLRLFKWKVLDICIERTSNSAFNMFEPIFGREELLHIVSMIRDTEECVDRDKKDMNVPEIEKIPNMNDDQRKVYNEKVKKRLFYIAELREMEIRLVRRRYIEHFFDQVFYCEQGIQIVDKLLFEENRSVYDQTHWNNCPTDWPARDAYFARFYHSAGESKTPVNRCDHQLLDSVSCAARGNLIYSFFANNPFYEREQRVTELFLNDDNLNIRTEFVRDVLDEGPSNYIERNAEGEEITRPNPLIWNIHKTNLLFATFALIDVGILPESKKDDWYYNLLEALSKDPHGRAALWFLHRNYKEALKEKEIERQRERLLLFDGSERSKGETAIDDQDEVDTLRPQPDDLAYVSDDDENNAELNLRIYQEELVRPALIGKNTVIVAPTGSGKTEVAIFAALEHIRKRAEKKKASRVVMLVPKIPLVSQQADRFLKYCRGKYYVEQCYGSEHISNGKGRKDDVLRSHIVVMTPQILLNMWQSVRESERLYVCDFSMVIFDEVHKTTGNHPYGEIARMIQIYKGTEKPQVIGLTASLNVKATASNDMSRMLGEIYKLLAMLNATVLSTIQNPDSIAELNKHVSRPDDSVVPCQPPLKDRSRIRQFIQRLFRELHDKLLVDIEKIIAIRAGNVFQKNFMRNAKNLNLDDVVYYESWLQQVSLNLDKVNSHEKMVPQMNVEYLKSVVEARGIVEVMPAYVAFDYLDMRFSEMRRKHNFPQFSQLFDNNRETLNLMKNNSEDNADPEIVAQLKNTLKNQFEESPNSRAIIFVVQRSTAERVSNFLNECRVLGGEHDFDYVLGSNNQGAVKQSQTKQESVIKRFNDGKLKVMVATSVVEEGLDVATCNLIIKYNCSSGSAIQLTQQRGRARAKNSRSVLLVVTGKVNENENNALISEKYMRQCVARIQKDGQKNLEKKVEEESIKLKREREQEVKEKMIREKSLQSKLYTVTCTKCSLEFCKSDKIKKKYSNYMMMDPDVWDKLELETRKRANNKYIDDNTQPLCNLKCTKCRSEIGKAFKQNGVYVPQLDIRALSFVETNKTIPHVDTGRKWLTVEQDLFYIAEAHESHFKEMLNALNRNEKNCAKKRILDGESQQLLKEVKEREERETRRRQAEERKKNERQQPKASWDDNDKKDENEEKEENEDKENKLAWDD
ncbi:unnamed protein product [Caenorhabditis angaria]|uniref:RNA helicase n=1 Tax=Caenorhabditis angaria TaxID=860376 RepID=A0A9P1MWS8_9PELO|nr:unnamed protein product [Caenorhabditis angaria]